MKLYILIIIIVAIILVIGFNFNMAPKTEFAKVKAKTHTYEEVPGFVKQNFKAHNEIIPERGLYFYSDINYPEEFVVDVDKKTVKYSLKPQLSEHNNGTIKLSDKQITEIVVLANKIWANQSDYESTRIPARMTISNLLLVDRGVYRGFDFDGFFEGEIEQLHHYLLSLVSEQGTKKSPANVSEKDSDTIKSKLEQFLKAQNITATFRTESGMLVIEHNIVPRLVQRKAGKTQDSKTVVEEDMVPAEDGFRIFVWGAQYVGQAVRPQELKTYGSDGKLVYTDYLGTTDPSADEGEERIDYTIGYGTKVKKEFLDQIINIINTNTMVREQKLIPRNFPFFKKAKIFIKSTPSLNTGDTQRAIDAETGFEYWKYIAVKEGEETEIGNLYSVKEEGTTETHAEKFNALIKEEKLNLNKTQAKEFADMVLKLSFHSVYSKGEIKSVVEEDGVFKATARLRQTIGLVPYHDESDLEFTFNKDGALIQFKQSEWEEVEGH